jgi:hypothetical protein
MQIKWTILITQKYLQQCDYKQILDIVKYDKDSNSTANRILLFIP